MPDTTSTLSIAVKNPSRRIVELDALRGLAALAVVLFHFTTRFEELFGHATPLFASLSWGDYGVDLFFMLSGFVILMSLERTRSSWQFAWGRLTRLYPPYWVGALITFLVVRLVGLPGQEVTLWDALLNVTMLQSLLKAEHIDGAYWSLQAELIFYFNMLLLYQFKAWRRPALTVAVWVGLSLAVHAVVQSPTGFLEALTPLFTKFQTVASLKFIPLFGMGILLYDMYRRGITKAGFASLLFCGITIGVIHGSVAGFIDLALVGILFLAVSERISWLRWKPFVWLGAISYPLYLTHQNLGYVLIRNLEAVGIHPLLAILAAFAAALALAGWLHEAVEVPSQKVLRKVDFTVGWKQQIASIRYYISAKK